MADTLHSGPFHQALHDAIVARGLSLARLGALLDATGTHIGQSTLSYWQRGLRRPDMPKSSGAVLALERVLELPPRSLINLLDPGVKHTPRTVRTAVDMERDLRNEDLELLALYEMVTINAVGARRSLLSRMVVQARRAGVDRYLALHGGDGSGSVEHSTMHTAEGCRAGRLRRRLPDGSVLFELALDRTLAAGETHVFSYSVIDTGGTRTAGHLRRFATPAGTYLLQLRFHRSALPARCFRESRDHAETEIIEVAPGRDGVVSAYFAPVSAPRAGISVLWSSAAEHH
ncbi:MAG: hypothetical protein JOZ47_06090 [Kutzneria sp.]|nr:hypothetical protein [Kutzneria sp.]MBV9844623.1 hypothetical protein [Kutzneria sp.]